MRRGARGNGEKGMHMMGYGEDGIPKEGMGSLAYFIAE